MKNLALLPLLFLALLSSQLASSQEICPKGQFFDLTRQACQNCPPGTFANGTVPLSQCETCRAGTYEINRSLCLLCPEGTYSNNGTSGLENCIRCSPGFVSGAGSANCRKCPAGSHEVNRKTCPDCPAGTYSKEGSTECNRCQAGWYTYRPGSPECRICEAGTYEVNRIICYLCPSGTASNARGASDKSTCVGCAAGSIAHFSGSAQCEKCPQGTYEVDRRDCVPCPSDGRKGVSDCSSVIES